MKILMIGCTGFIGKELIPFFLQQGHQLTILSRRNMPNISTNFTLKQVRFLQLDPSNIPSWNQEVLINALQQVEAVINLAGEPIADKRWTQKHCEKIRNSRLITTQSLVDALGKLKQPPKVLVNASAIGYYGSSQEQLFTENSPCGKDFLANLCKDWEELASKKPSPTRLVIIRIGIVIGAGGGALGKMLPIFKAGLGGPIGDGRQWMSWIHRTDLCRIIEKALVQNSWRGVVNGVAPEPVRMNQFVSVLGECIKRPCVIPVPGAILKLLLGDGAKVVLEGQKVSSKKLNELQFNFEYPSLAQAINSSTIAKKH